MSLFLFRIFRNKPNGPWEGLKAKHLTLLMRLARFWCPKASLSTVLAFRAMSALGQRQFLYCQGIYQYSGPAEVVWRRRIYTTTGAAKKKVYIEGFPIHHSYTPAHEQFAVRW